MDFEFCFSPGSSCTAFNPLSLHCPTTLYSIHTSCACSVATVTSLASCVSNSRCVGGLLAVCVCCETVMCHGECVYCVSRCVYSYSVYLTHCPSLGQTPPSLDLTILMPEQKQGGLWCCRGAHPDRLSRHNPAQALQANAGRSPREGSPASKTCRCSCKCAIRPALSGLLA